jgi:hypothetical protein
MPMQAKDGDVFAGMLAAVAAIYGREMTPEVTAIYFAALAPYDLAAVRQAFDRHVKNPDSGQFMPKPADLIRMLGGTTADSAMAAWTKVERAIRRVGGGNDVVFDDPVIHRAIEDMGGWMKLCAVLEEELPFRAKEFQNYYRGYVARREQPEYPRVLVGMYSTYNSARGYASAPPVLIGDVEACRKVMQIGRDGPAPLSYTATPLLESV